MPDSASDPNLSNVSGAVKRTRPSGFVRWIVPVVVLGGTFLGAGILWTNRYQFCRQFPDALYICRPGPFIPGAVLPGGPVPGAPIDPVLPVLPELPEDAPLWCRAACDLSRGVGCPAGFTCEDGTCNAPACQTETGLCGDPCIAETFTTRESGCTEPLDCRWLDPSSEDPAGICVDQSCDVPPLDVEDRIGWVPAWCGAVCDDALGMSCPEGLTCLSGFCTGNVCASNLPEGACGAACTNEEISYVLGCDNGLSCVDGQCTDPEICVRTLYQIDVEPEPIITVRPPIFPPGVTPENVTPISSTLCASPEQGGVAWQGTFCSCDGLETNISTCANGQQIVGAPTGNTCPAPADCAPTSGGGGSADCSAVGQACNLDPQFGACPAGYQCGGPYDEFNYGTCQKAGCP